MPIREKAILEEKNENRFSTWLATEGMIIAVFISQKCCLFLFFADTCKSKLKNKIVSRKRETLASSVTMMN